MKSQEEVLKIITDYGKLKEELEELVLTVFYNAKKYKFAEGSVDEFDFGIDGISGEYSKVNINWSDSWAYGGYDSGIFTFPIDLLYSDSELYYKTERERIDNELIKKEEKKRKQKEKDEEKLYLKLKEKFEKK